MYDMTKFKTRYFDVKLRNGKPLNVEPPKMKMLKKISSLSSIKDTDNLSESDIDNLIEALSLALSKNKQNYKVSTTIIEEEYNILEVIDFLNAYFNWINSIQVSKN